MKPTIAMDEFEHREAMRQLAAHNARNNRELDAKAAQALEKIEAWKSAPKPEKPAPIPRVRGMGPPPLKKKRVVCSVSTGQAFREYRESLGLRSVDVYTAAGMDKETLHGLERGNRKWTESIRRKIAKAINSLASQKSVEVAP